MRSTIVPVCICIVIQLKYNRTGNNLSNNYTNQLNVYAWIKITQYTP